MRVATRSKKQHPAPVRASSIGCGQELSAIVIAGLLTTMVLVAVSVIGASAAHAGEPGTSAVSQGEVVALAKSVDAVLDNIRNWLMGILAGLATVFLSIGGVRYVMAGGDPGEVEKAKTAFKSAGWGYGLATLAPLVVEILKGIVGV